MKAPSFQQVKRFILRLLVLPVLLYAGDAAYFRLKVALGGLAAATGTVKFYQAAALKGGKVEVYFDSPQTETCAHSLFTEEGHRPCWYASRDPVHVVGEDGQPMFLPDMRKTY
jgi:hypothetical protein